jgi:hypothetical protein
MPLLSTRFFCGVQSFGGVLSYPSDKLYEEVAHIAYHFHWSKDDILNLEHWERQHWVKQINQINQQRRGDN